MNSINLHLYLVLDAATCGGRLLSVADAALQSGISVLQLRGHKTAWNKRAWYDAALALQPRCAAHGVPFIINDQVDIALAVGADGVHIGQNDLPPAVVRRLLGKERLLGLSTHSVAQVQAADTTIVDYIGMGPVFPTRSKADADPAIGLDGLAAMVAAKRLPGVAIGGINADNAAAVRAVNSDGIAVIGAICAAADPHAATRALQ
ncbi:thiamine phosphate synthase [uncultured Cardiobacterium sp.]|uniref:thiamine phosphate synthase n=1 Tax=uncultured Cardiobacterium sp. TaxID=417619 RepID=UPI0026292F6F|nr:thiamine phosphate synthase [uncultured Cardiobacterium sp.]